MSDVKEVSGILIALLPWLLGACVLIVLPVTLLLSLFNTKKVKMVGKKKVYAVPIKGMAGWFVWGYDVGFTFLIYFTQLFRIPGWLGYRPLIARMFFNDVVKTEDWGDANLILSVQMLVVKTTGNINVHRRGVIRLLKGFNGLYNSGVIHEVLTIGQQSGHLTTQGGLGRVIYQGKMIAHKGSVNIGEIAVNSLYAKKAFFGGDIFIQDDAVFDACVFADGVTVFYANNMPKFHKCPVAPNVETVHIGKHYDVFERIKQNGIATLVVDDTAVEIAQPTVEHHHVARHVTEDVLVIDDVPVSSTQVTEIVEWNEQGGQSDIDGDPLFEEVGIDPSSVSNEELAELVGEEVAITTVDTEKQVAVSELVSALQEVVEDKATTPTDGPQLALVLGEDSEVVATHKPEILPKDDVQFCRPDIQPNSIEELNEDLKRVMKMEEQVRTMSLELDMRRQQHQVVLDENKALEKELRNCKRDRERLEEVRGELAIRKERERTLRAQIRALEDRMDAYAKDLAKV